MRMGIAISFVIVGVILGLYVALWLCLVGGIVMVVEACKATPVQSMGIALGVLRIFCTGIAGWFTFWVCALIGGLISGKK